MMYITEKTVRAADLLSSVKKATDEGYELVSMYIQEPSGNRKRVLEIIMLSQDNTLRISLKIDNEYPSLTSIIPSEQYEREIFEMNGIYPSGYGDVKPLRLRYSQENEYPLQKTPYTNQKKRPLSIPHNGMDGDGIFEIPVGPIHAGVIEPNHFRFSVAGEPILMLRVHLGFTHRRIEKLLETQISKDNTFMAERICGDNGIAHSLAYLQAIEKDTAVPERAKFIRVIFAELERIHCHLNGISGIALDTALSVPAAKGYAMREKILRLNEHISGHRFLWGVLMPGGLRKDVENDKLSTIEMEIMKLSFELDEMIATMRRSPSFTDRAEVTGTLSTDDAERLGVVGPIARASGIEYDVRKVHPYEAYDITGFKIPVHTAGDVYSRLMVKSNEIRESISMIYQCIGFIENGPIFEKVEDIDGFSIGVVESPRGEIVHCVNVNDKKIWRYKIRDPSFLNWPAIETAVIGNIVPDFPLINKSFDLSCSGNDL